jgi:uridylate kinase
VTSDADDDSVVGAATSVAVHDAPTPAFAGDGGVAPYRRILLKLSGEALMGGKPAGVDMERVKAVAEQIRDVVEGGVQVAIVVGGGNFLRGAEAAQTGLDRATGDYMGCIATVLNALPVQDALEKLGVATRVLSALELHEVAEPYIRRRAIRHLEKGRVVIFAGGTGNPYFTTDTAAALRALEIGAEVLLMAKNGVDGVYTADPKTDAAAQFLPQLTHKDALRRNLRVMDQTALALCSEHEMTIRVFNMDEPHSIERVARGEQLGTVVEHGD